MPELGRHAPPRAPARHRAREGARAPAATASDAEEAHRWGSSPRSAPEGEALDRALALAERLAALPPLAVAVAKQAIDAMAESSRDAGLALERLAYGMLAQTEDAREAAAAFSEKRPPRFRGR